MNFTKKIQQNDSFPSPPILLHTFVYFCISVPERNHRPSWASVLQNIQLLLSKDKQENNLSVQLGGHYQRTSGFIFSYTIYVAHQPLMEHFFLNQQPGTKFKQVVFSIIISIIFAFLNSVALWGHSEIFLAIYILDGKKKTLSLFVCLHHCCGFFCFVCLFSFCFWGGFF